MNLFKHIALTVSVLICLGMALLDAQGCLMRQESDEDLIAQTPDVATPGQDQLSQLQERFFSELDLLIPGEFHLIPPLKRASERPLTRLRRAIAPRPPGNLKNWRSSTPLFRRSRCFRPASFSQPAIQRKDFEFSISFTQKSRLPRNLFCFWSTCDQSKTIYRCDRSNRESRSQDRGQDLFKSGRRVFSKSIF